METQGKENHNLLAFRREGNHKFSLIMFIKLVAPRERFMNDEGSMTYDLR